MEKIKTILNKIKEKFISIIHNKNVINDSIYIVVILITILFGINTYITAKHNQEYHERANAGNARWHQVEEVITNTENRVDMLQEKVKELTERVNELENEINN